MPNVFMIVFSHEDYNGANIIPSDDTTPRIVYATIDGAENALTQMIEGLSNYSPALYGEAYPIENTTARNEIAKKGSAVYGWTRDAGDDGEIIQYGIYIIVLPLE
jgi:hypothetical protein|uniref:Uncharacterized protein n=1 Tax=viral metagenome TaxID=1070528 RepID=A0A6C0K0J0_9ZZZZ